MNFLYNFFIRFYKLGILVSAIAGNKKARLWLDGRKNIFSDIELKLKSETIHSAYGVIWAHCASLGEFEQGRTLMEKIKLQYPQKKIILTFFSPSGYEIRKNYSGADAVFYLPLDTPGNARDFISLVNPELVFFIKYEFWFNYLKELKRKRIPVYLVSGIFRKEQYFFKWYGRWAAEKLKIFRHIFTQDKTSNDLLKKIGISSTIAGDTRFDRVLDVFQNRKEIPLIKNFCMNGVALVAGSTWRTDEQMIAGIDLRKLNLKLIVVPHEIDEAHLIYTENLFSKYRTGRFTKISPDEAVNFEILIVDTIGMLSSVYQYGKLAYIGGGFGAGIHNTLEAAVFGLPVIFGPNYQKFREAKELIALGGAYSFKSFSELNSILDKLTSEQEAYQKSVSVCRNYVEQNKGATDLILKEIFVSGS